STGRFSFRSPRQLKDAGPTLSGLVIRDALTDQIEVELLVSAQGDRGTHNGTYTVSQQGTDQDRIFAQAAQTQVQSHHHRDHAQYHSHALAQQAESHQANHDAGANASDKLSSQAYETFQRNHAETGQKECNEGSNDGRCECQVGDAIPVQADNHREHDGTPQR